jgi:hypothetical protein
MKNKLFLFVFGLVMTTQMIFAQVPSYVPTNGLVGYWPFNGNANDQTANGNNGTVNGATLTTDRNGNANSAYSFDGISNYIQTQSTFSLVTGTASRTVSLWLKTAGNISGRQSAVVWGTQVGCYGKFNINVSRNSGSSISLITGCGIYDNPAVVLDNNWHNIICVFDSSLGLNTATARYYLDGVLLSNNGGGSFLTANINTQPGPIVFGRDGTNDILNGKLDDVAIWSRALSQQEITAMYNQVSNYSDTCNNVSGSLTQGLVGYWPFCGNANDDSGHGNNGVVNGATLTTDRFGNNNSAYNFDGLSNYIDLNKQLPNTFSISLWVSVSSFKTYIAPGNNIIGSKIISTYNNNFEFSGFECETNGNQNLYGQHSAAFWNPNPISIIGVTSISNLVVNQWKNIIMTFDGSILKYFINGALESSSNAVFTQNNRKLFIGAREFHINGPDFFFHGKLDDIGIWNRALTQQEITQLYNQNQCITNVTVTDTLIINVGQLSYTNPVTYANNITIYPNPANTQVNISFNNITNLTGGTIKVVNSLGQQVATTPVTLSGTNTTLPLSTWGGTGMYFVQILNAQGIVVDVKKIILQ